MNKYIYLNFNVLKLNILIPNTHKMMILCDPFSRSPHRCGGDGMRKKDTEIPPERAFI
jgi:hypothetical protein